MKRIFACIIAFVMIFTSMTACVNDEVNESSQIAESSRIDESSQGFEISQDDETLQGDESSQADDNFQGDESSNVNEFLVGHIQVLSGENNILPFGCLLWSKIDNGDGTFTETHADKYDVVDLVSGKTDFSENDIPTIILDEKVSYLVQVNGSVEKVYLITPNGNEHIKSDTTFDDLSELDKGAYYVVLEVLLSGGNCDHDAPQNSYYYEDVFRLVVEG